MILGKITGTVVSTEKHKVLEGHKLLIVQPINPDGEKKGKSLVAIDVVQAGIGDIALVMDEGNSGRMILGDPEAPVRSVIVGIVDAVENEQSR